MLSEALLDFEPTAETHFLFTTAAGYAVRARAKTPLHSLLSCDTTPLKVKSTQRNPSLVIGRGFNRGTILASINPFINSTQQRTIIRVLFNSRLPFKLTYRFSLTSQRGYSPAA
ncbi:hypothetical protein CN397_18870 [Priestia megaterium]|nr:hypothetical protein CN397_18870 [Priestia megaterium]